jgi:hypothetical protein
MKSRLAVNALRDAVARRGHVAGCVVHTDRRTQFALDALPDQLIDYPAAGIRAYQQGVLFSVQGWHLHAGAVATPA